MSAREEILGRIRGALADVPAGEETPVPWEYAQPTPTGDLLDQFVDRVADYRADVERCAAPDIGARVRAALDGRGVRRVVIPAALRETVGDVLQDLDVADESAAGSTEQLEAVHGVVTGARVGIADTGTIVLDHGPDQGPRALTLLPDLHVCILRADQIVSGVPEAIRLLGPGAVEGRPLTLISGPSATSDIELTRVEGVHGPRALHVIVVDP